MKLRFKNYSYIVLHIVFYLMIILFVFATFITILDNVNFLDTSNRIKQDIINNNCKHEGNEEKKKGNLMYC
jgi:uncharacterized membrane protein